MTANEIKQKAKAFCKTYNLSAITCATLKKTIEKQGYTIVEYNHVYNDENAKKLIEVLNLTNYVIRSKGFTYADDNYRIVFVHEDLSDEEKRIVLAHEAGHIFLNHLSPARVIGKDVHEEYEANEFAHFLLNPSANTKLMSKVKNHKKTVIACVTVLLIIIAGIVTALTLHTENQYYGEYYLTASGYKYHKKNCVFVKNKDNVRRLTKEEFDNGEYEPCEMCLPESETSQ